MKGPIRTKTDENLHSGKFGANKKLIQETVVPVLQNRDNHDQKVLLGKSTYGV